jgi:hypothetical protein
METGLTRSFRVAALLATSALTFAAGAAEAANKTARPLFAVIPRLVPNVKNKAPITLPGTWVYSYTYNSRKYNETWIGGNPSTATSETVPIYLVPFKLTYKASGAKKVTEDASKIIPNIIASPIFTPLDFKFGGTDIGTTQYEDAFAKVNVWQIGGSASGYHVLLGTPTVEKSQTLKLTSSTSEGVITEFGAKVLTVQINTIDAAINKLITSLKIPSTALPIFVTSQTYLISGSECCIGGYHSVTNAGQPYSMFTFINYSGSGELPFSADVSALSHELGEWIDDPYTNNSSPCGIYEVGDPLERNTNYGDFAYTLNGVTYHLQDLALLPYFGGPTGVTLGNLDTLQGETLKVCQNGA